MNYFETMSDYGSSRTRKFSDIFPTFQTFQTFWSSTIFSKQAVALIQNIPEDTGNGASNLELIYELLMANYANSAIASNDENRFKYDCMCTVFQYAPAYIKRLEIQHTLHELDLNSEDFLRGSMQLHNVSLNPSEDPAADTLSALSTINQQTASIQKRDKFKALAILEELLRTDITGAFIDHFKRLFRWSVSPQRPLLYRTEVNPQ